MRTKEPTISQVEIGGKIRHRVTFWTPSGRQREHHTDLRDAERRVAEIKRDAKQYGAAAEAMTAEQRASAISALRLLDGTGVTLDTAVRFFLDAHRRRTSGKPIEEAVSFFLRSRESRSDGYRRSLRPRLELLARHFQGKTTTEIGPDELQDFLDALAATNAPKTVLHYRTAAAMLFRYAEARGWCERNPVLLTAKIRLPDTTPEILTPAEAASILEHTPDEIRAGIVLQLFVGIRRAEVMRLDWRDIDLDQRTVTIGGMIAKTGSRRVAPIPENAVAWIRPLARKSGTIIEDTTRTRDLWTLARVRAGFGPFFTDDPATRAAIEKAGDPTKAWPANALRHSAISYRLAIEPDLARAAYSFGNSPGVIQRSYNGLATPSAARAFFALLPAEPGNVTRISKGAA